MSEAKEVKPPERQKNTNPRFSQTYTYRPRKIIKKKKQKYPEFKDLTSRMIEQQDLIDEINNLQDEIYSMYEYFDEIKNEEFEDFAKMHEFNEKYYPSKNNDDKGEIDYFSKLQVLEDENYELRQQILFFTSYFSEKNVKKYEEEILKAQKEIESLNDSLINDNLASELQSTSRSMSLTMKRELYSEIMENEYETNKIKLDELKTENSQLKDIRTELITQTSSAVENRKTLAMLTEELKQLQSQRKKLQDKVERFHRFGVKYCEIRNPSKK